MYSISPASCIMKNSFSAQHVKIHVDKHMFEHYNKATEGKQTFDNFMEVQSMAQATYGSRKKKKYYPKRIAAAALIIGFLIILVTAEPANADGTYEGARYKYYTSVYVEQGDSLWSIAEEHWTKEYSDICVYIQEIKQLNQITSDTIQSGTYLCIPYYSGQLQK